MKRLKVIKERILVIMLVVILLVTFVPMGVTAFGNGEYDDEINLSSGEIEFMDIMPLSTNVYLESDITATNVLGLNRYPLSGSFTMNGVAYSRGIAGHGTATYAIVGRGFTLLTGMFGRISFTGGGWLTVTAGDGRLLGGYTLNAGSALIPVNIPIPSDVQQVHIRLEGGGTILGFGDAYFSASGTAPMTPPTVPGAVYLESNIFPASRSNLNTYPSAGAFEVAGVASYFRGMTNSSSTGTQGIATYNIAGRGFTRLVGNLVRWNGTGTGTLLVTGDGVTLGEYTLGTGMLLQEIDMAIPAGVQQVQLRFQTASGTQLGFGDAYFMAAPVITTQPVNRTVNAGQNATFTVAATGAASFQWQVSINNGSTWINVSGGTSATLTLSNVTAAMNNNRYRVNVTNAAGTVTSNQAIITVNTESPTGLIFTVGNVKSTAGSIIEVPITIVNNPGIAAISNLRIDLGAGLSFHYPQGQAAYGANPATWPFITRSGSGFFDGMIPISGRPQDGNIGSSHIVFNFMDSAEPFDSTENGTLVTLRLSIAEIVPGGTEIPITITVDGVRNSSQQVISFHAENGSVTVQDFLYGDVTSTGSVDIFSVQALLIWLNSGSPAGGLANEAAGRVTSTTGRPDIFDAQALLQWINSGGNAAIGHPGPNINPSAAFSAASMPLNSETNLVIEVDSRDAKPGDIIDVPILITNNPGVSAIKELRIDLGSGLSLHYPQGQAAYAANPTTWPFITRTGSGHWDGMIPISGRPQDGNIGNTHIVFNFMDSSNPFDSTETGILVTLRLKVDESASGDLSITLNGGSFISLQNQVERFSVFLNGVVSTPSDGLIYGLVIPINERPADCNGEPTIADVVRLLEWLDPIRRPNVSINLPASMVVYDSTDPDRAEPTIADAVRLLEWLDPIRRPNVILGPPS
jgi:hypothetical protein